ncbi:MAG: SecY-interacting protein Syd [Oscillospiraceae bacterium]|nr:SecY-interacting protein Syd [Oscillospiraceae bacterium]
MSMRESFEIFFEKQSDLYYSCRDFIIKDPPKAYKQTEPVSFDKIEKSLGFIIHQSIKEYFSTYYFEQLEGFFEHEWFYMLNIMPSDHLSEIITTGFRNGKDNYHEDSKYFVIGTSKTGKVMVNNTTGEVTKVTSDEKTSKHFADSLEEFLRHVECEYSKQ